MKTFEQWYNSTKKADSIVEAAEDNVPVAKSSTSIESDTTTTIASPEATGEEGYSKMMQDCDDIINSLKTLSDQLTESEDQPLNEANPMGQVLMEDPIIMGAVLGLTAVIGAVGLGAKAIKDGAKNKKTIKEAEKDYSKLKKLKMQTVKMEVAVLSLEDKRRELSTTESIEEAGDDVKAKASAANKKKALQKMKAKLDNQIESMRQKKDGINSAATEYGSSLEVKYSKVSGFGSGKVKTLIADMRDQITTEVSEYKLDAWGDKMSAETKKDLKERITKSKQAQKERMDKITAEQEKNAKKLDDAAKNDEKVKAELEQIKAEKEKGKEKEEAPEETPEETPTETPEETPEKEDDFDAFGTDGDDEESPEEETEEVDKTDNSKEGMTKRVDAVIAKAEESGDEAKLKKAKELKAKILAKESWQLNNTKLGLIFESDLRKMEMESLIQESISVKDRFSKLI
jgi:hypothetical protein